METGKSLFQKINEVTTRCRERFKQTYDNVESYRELRELYRYIIDVATTIEEPLAYLALGQAYFGIRESEQQDDNGIACYIKYLQHPDPSIDIFSKMNVFMQLAEAFERKYEFLEAIKYYELYDIEFDKQFVKPPKAIYKNECGEKLKFMQIKENGFDGFIRPNDIIGNLYLKINPLLAIEYWEKQKKSQYYEEKSYFKNRVDSFLYDALQKQKSGYLFKPQTKEAQAKFLEVAKIHGWR